MIEITLDASQLELFEVCPRKWYYAHVLNLAPLQARRSFDIGSYYHDCLEFYYKLPLQGITDITEKFKMVVDHSADENLLNLYGIKSTEDRLFHRKRLIDYFAKWQDEDAALKMVAVEQGFSTLLYEDNYRRYILEGKIDIVAEDRQLGLFVMDHKTQARFDDRWEFNHQVCNYLSFTKANYFVYNYIGLQQSLPKEGMRRMIYKPHEGMLEQWRSEVLVTFEELYAYMQCQTDLYSGNEGKYPRRRAACDNSKYGLCQFHKICSIPDGSKWVPAVFSAYKEQEKRWRPWT